MSTLKQTYQSYVDTLYEIDSNLDSYSVNQISDELHNAKRFLIKHDHEFKLENLDTSELKGQIDLLKDYVDTLHNETQSRHADRLSKINFTFLLMGFILAYLGNTIKNRGPDVWKHHKNSELYLLIVLGISIVVSILVFRLGII